MTKIIVGYKDGEIWFSCLPKSASSELRDVLCAHTNVSVHPKSSALSIPDTDRENLGAWMKPFQSIIQFDRTYLQWRNNFYPIKISSGVIRSRITDGVSTVEIDKAIDKKLSYFTKGAEQTKAYKNGRWDGRTRLYSKKYRSFPSGLLYLVEEALHEIGFHNIKIKYEYKRHVDRQFNWRPKKLFTLSEDQEIAIKTIIANPRGVVKAATGFGKTSAIARFVVAELGVPTLFIANKKALLSDAKDDFINGIIGLNKKHVGEIMQGDFCGHKITPTVKNGKKVKPKPIKEIATPIVVGTVQSINSRLQDPVTKRAMTNWLKKDCKLVIIDEGQYLGTDVWDNVLKKVMAPYRIVLSATPKRTDGGTIKINAVSGPIIYEASSETQIEAGRICELDIQYLSFDHKLYNKNEKGVDYKSFYDFAIVQNSRRNRQCVINPVLEMLEEERIVLVLVTMIDHGTLLEKEFLKAGLKRNEVAFISGETPDDKRKAAIEKTRKGKIKVLIGSTIFDAGVDIPVISGVVLAAAGNSDITLTQRIGRGARTVDYIKALGRLPKFMENESTKTTRVIDIADMNVKFFSEQARGRMEAARQEFGEDRVHLIGSDTIKNRGHSGYVNVESVREESDKRKRAVLDSYSK